MDNKQCTRTPSKCLSLRLKKNTKKKWLSPSSGITGRTSSEPKAKYVWMHAWLSLGNFCIPQSTPFTWVPKPCGYAASVVLANCKGKHWKFRRRRICSAGPSEANKNNGCEHAESLARRDTALACMMASCCTRSQIYDDDDSRIDTKTAAA